jgi:hypothetical protein
VAFGLDTLGRKHFLKINNIPLLSVFEEIRYIHSGATVRKAKHFGVVRPKADRTVSPSACHFLHRAGLKVKFGEPYF